MMTVLVSFIDVVSISATAWLPASLPICRHGHYGPAAARNAPVYNILAVADSALSSTNMSLRPSGLHPAFKLSARRTASIEKYKGAVAVTGGEEEEKKEPYKKEGRRRRRGRRKGIRKKLIDVPRKTKNKMKNKTKKN